MFLKKFKKDIEKYYKYAVYSARAQLKSEVANSYLNWLWWILDPLCFMLIYVFMFGYIFNAREQYFPLFVFIGLTMWDFFNKTLKQSVKIVKHNRSVVSKVYLPKYILILIKIGVNGFKMGISFLIIIGMLIFWRVPLTWNVIFVIPILLTLFFIVFGLGCFLLHFGVFVEDLSNVINIVLRFVFYLTGIFWNISTKLPAPLNTIAGKCNPVAFLLTSMRNCLIYEKTPDVPLLGVWLLAGILLSISGIFLIYKNENSYVKVI